MKLNVMYCLNAEVEIPEEEVQKVLATKDCPERGHLFSVLAQKYNPDLLDRLHGEITGVYNPYTSVSGVINFENPDYDEALWES